VITGFTSRNFFEAEHLELQPDEHFHRWENAAPALSNLKSGDLIFRHGRGFISNALMSLGQRERKYSHAGIISIENGNVFVYHAIGGEQNISNKLRKDRLEVFCNPEDVHAFGIYRSDLNPEQIENAMNSVDVFYKNELEFDTKFDLLSNDKMYCTEMLYKIFNGVTGNRNYISLSAVGSKKYIACDDFYLSPHFKHVYSYTY
jgi:hypothetical protein